jgi:hypothetical protein
VINLWKDFSDSGNETAMGLKKCLYYFSPKNMLNKHMIGDGITTEENIGKLF